MSIVTDSTPLEEPKDPDTCNVFSLIKLFADAETTARVRAAYQAGGYGYGHAKKELLGLITEYFADARERRRDLEKRPDYVRDVLRDGASKAREKSDVFMARARELTGILRSGS